AGKNAAPRRQATAARRTMLVPGQHDASRPLCFGLRRSASTSDRGTAKFGDDPLDLALVETSRFVVFQVRNMADAMFLTRQAGSDLGQFECGSGENIFDLELAVREPLL